MLACPANITTRSRSGAALTSPQAVLLVCLICGCFLHSAPGAASPPTAATPAAVAARHEQVLAEGTAPAEVLREARQRWQHDRDSLEKAADLLVALDEPSLRKTQLEEVVAAADRLIAIVKAAELPADERAAWVADSLYRKGRALGYMELPEVLEVRPIKDPQRHHEQFEAAFKQLDALVDTTRPEFILLRIRRERRRGQYEEALRLLEIYREAATDPVWYEKKRGDILRESEAANR